MEFHKVPISLGMALAQNEEALKAFARMTKEEKQAVWKQARKARSEQEIQAIADSIIQ